MDNNDKTTIAQKVTWFMLSITVIIPVCIVVLDL